jgi:NADH-quinone oxidoreductase subunit E
LSETNDQETLTRIFSRYQGLKDDLIPILQDVQEELGYLSKESMAAISRFLKIPDSNVYGVATFYALFKLRPAGKKIVRVCRGTACHVKGQTRVLNEIQTRLGIQPGEVTPDMEYELETVACIGACALAPVMTIGKEVHGQMTAQKAVEVFGDRYKSKPNE